MGIDAYTPAQLAAYLRGQDLKGLRQLQATGHAQFDGGIDINGAAQLNDTDLAALVKLVPRRYDLQVVPAGQTAASIRIPPVGSFPLTGYSNVVVKYMCRASTAASLLYLTCQVDGDTSAANYYVTEARFIAGSITTTDVNLGTTAQWFIGLVGRSDLINEAGGQFQIPFFQSAVFNKQFFAHTESVYSGSAGINEQRLLSGLHIGVGINPLDHLVMTVNSGNQLFASGTFFLTILEP